MKKKGGFVRGVYIGLGSPCEVEGRTGGWKPQLVESIGICEAGQFINHRLLITIRRGFICRSQNVYI